MNDSKSLPMETDVATLAAMREAGDSFVLLDVREEDEHAHCRIDGSMLIPVSQLRDRFSELESHREDRIIVHCHHGGRSMQVTEALRSSGFSKAQNLAGGIDQWSQQIDPTVPRY